MNNYEKYKKDLEALIGKGMILNYSMQYACYPKEFEQRLPDSSTKAEKDKFLAALPSFNADYQNWYSEALSIIKLILPDRLGDFIKLYEKPKSRKSIEYGNYVIEDYLQNLRVTSHGETKVDKTAAIPQFEQQLNILKSVSRKFESSLFNISSLVQADVFDSELDGAKELQKNKFYRAAGVIAGVILEKHLLQVCKNHNLSLTKRNPTINDYNELLKTNEVISVPQWRHIQMLADIRNICGHGKEVDPTEQQVKDLIDGVEKIIKTVY